MPIRKRKTVQRKRLKKPSELEKRKAEISKLRGQMRTWTKELKRQIEEKEALLLEKDKELASMRDLMEKKVKGLESSLVQKEELIGRITHYYSHLSVCIIELTGGELRVGDVIHIKGEHTDLIQTRGFHANRAPERQPSREREGRWGQGKGKSEGTRSGFPCLRSRVRLN